MPTAKYRDDKGTRLKGVTTVINAIWTETKQYYMLNWSAEKACNYEDGIHKPIYWMWERNRAGYRGTDYHSIIETYLRIKFLELKASLCFLSDTKEKELRPYLDWIDQNITEVYLLEQPMINPVDNYGGTFDALVNVKGYGTTILDFKTGYTGDKLALCYQLAAYWGLIEEGYKFYEDDYTNTQDAVCKVVDYGMVLGFNKIKNKIKAIPVSARTLEYAYMGFVHHLRGSQFDAKLKKVLKNE